MAVASSCRKHDDEKTCCGDKQQCNAKQRYTVENMMERIYDSSTIKNLGELNQAIADK